MKTFKCKRLRCSGLRHLSCIKRQLSTDRLECRDCEQGQAIMAAHPELVREARKAGRARRKLPNPQRTLPPRREPFETFYHKEPDMTVDVKALKKIKQNGGKDMAHTTEKKTCTRCGKEYKPTSNRQKACPDCKEPKRKERPGSLFKKRPGKKKTTAASLPVRSTRPQDPGDGPYLLINFEGHEGILDSIVQEARTELRAPEMQALAIIREALAGK